VTSTRSTFRYAVGAAVALTVVAAAVVRTPQPAVGAGDAVPGMAGTDISLPLTDSAATVAGRGPFAGMEVTVNQTRDLNNQAVSITWRGSRPTVSQGPRLFASDFVQIMQCWGEPDALVAENPGPPPEQCVWGALNPTAASELPGFATSMVTSRAFTHESFDDFDPEVGTRDESGEVFRDFAAVDGTVVTDHVDHTATGPFDQFWQNPYFNSVTSNEVPGVRTLEDGRGQALMTVDTGLESRGLGCGQRVQPNPAGEPTVPRCWLVIVPRGTAELENAGTPFGTGLGVATSPLRPASWQHRIAVELAFTPVDSSCDIAADQRQISGTELLVGAVSSWQPVLCTRPGLLPYAYGVVSDGLARQQLLSDVDGAPGMVAVNRPLPEDASTPDDPILYAPVSASAIAVGFNVERVVSLATTEFGLQGVRFRDINLTPRLVAKLLTQSYRSQVEIRGPSPYAWDDVNASHMLVDPDFLRFNPEFTLWQSGSGKHAGGLSLPLSSSDLAGQVWGWILADPEAAAWLAGTPDESGMVVNPLYATTAESNSTGSAFAAPPPDAFPKSDPYCHQAAVLASGVVPPPLCSLDWSPYAASFADAAHVTATANDGSKSVLNRFAGGVTDVWKRSSAQSLGRRTIFGLTDLPSVSKRGLQSARLSRAGDNGADREFIAADATGLSLAVQSMRADGGMLRLDPGAVDPGAYPLTTLTYAAVRPFALDDDAREQYAAFLDHAAGPGQTPGQKLGQLPPGYLPLPAALAQVTAAVADDLRTLEPPAPPPADGTTPPATPVAGGTVSSSSPSPEPAADSGTPPPVEVFSRAPSSTDADAAAPPAATDPVAEAPVRATPISQLTPGFPVGIGRYAVAAVAAIALAAALAALEITKRPRRRREADTASESRARPATAGTQP